MNNKQIYYAVVMVLIILLCLIALALAIPAAAYEGEAVRTARQDALHEAAELLRRAGYTDDTDAIKALQAAWWQEKEDLDIVARVVMGEAGGCPFDHQVAVAAVVVNRRNSPLFPATIREVVAAPMQYTPLYLYGFENTTRTCYEAAKIALDGTDEVPDDVVFQAEFVQGKEVWWRSEVDTGWYHSVTYFCR